MSSPVKMIAAIPLLVAALSQAQTLATSTPDAAAVSGEGSRTLRLEETDNLHIIIRKGFRIKGVGQSVTGEITQPVFHGEQ